MKWINWALIILWSTLRNKTVVDYRGSTYAVAGLIVKKVR